ncbi:unnamed protein product [Jaminaea pallidilutea]
MPHATQRPLEVLEPPPFSLVHPRRSNAGNLVNDPWAASSSSSSSSSNNNNTSSKGSVGPFGVNKGLPLSKSLASLSLSRSIASKKRAAQMPVAHELSPTGHQSSHLDEAQRDAIAALSLSHPRVPAYARPISIRSTEVGGDRGLDAFALYARQGALTSSRRGSGPEARAYSMIPRPRNPLASSKAKPATASPMGRSMTDDASDDDITFASGKHDNGDATIPQSASTLRNAGLEDALVALGWYWDSRAQAIWGQGRRRSRQGDSIPSSGFSGTGSEAMAKGAFKRPSTSEAHGVGMAPSASGRRNSSFEAQLHDHSRPRSGPSKQELESWSAFIDAYSAGRFDLGRPSERPKGSPPPEYCDASESEHSTTFKAPLPAWESERQAAVCRADIWNLPLKVRERIDVIRNRVKEELGVQTVYADVLFGDQGYLIQKEGVVLHNEWRRKTLCGHTILNSDRGMTVLDRRSDWRFCDNEKLHKVLFYSGQPICSASGLPLGTLCVMDPHPKDSFSDAQQEIIRQAAQQVSDVLEENSAVQFQRKMDAMCAALEGIQYSLKATDDESTRSMDSNGFSSSERNGAEALRRGMEHVDLALSQVKQALMLDCTYIVALSNLVDGEHVSANLLAASGQVAADDVRANAQTYFQALDVSEEACQVYQNISYDGASHPDLPHHSSRPSTCGLMMPLAHSANGSTALVLAAESARARHVLGIEDLRFLQSVQPLFETALQGAVERCCEVESQPKEPVAKEPAPLSFVERIAANVARAPPAVPCVLPPYPSPSQALAPILQRELPRGHAKLLSRTSAWPGGNSGRDTRSQAEIVARPSSPLSHSATTDGPTTTATITAKSAARPIRPASPRNHGNAALTTSLGGSLRRLASWSSASLPGQTSYSASSGLNGSAATAADLSNLVAAVMEEEPRSSHHPAVAPFELCSECRGVLPPPTAPTTLGLSVSPSTSANSSRRGSASPMDAGRICCVCPRGTMESVPMCSSRSMQSQQQYQHTQPFFHGEQGHTGALSTSVSSYDTMLSSSSLSSGLGGSSSGSYTQHGAADAQQLQTQQSTNPSKPSSLGLSSTGLAPAPPRRKAAKVTCRSPTS